MPGTNGHPLNPAGDGRTSRGTFATGNRFGRGNPANRRAQALRSVFIGAVTREEMREIARQQIEKALAGDTQAAAFVCDRIFGRPVADAVLVQQAQDALAATETRR